MSTEQSHQFYVVGMHCRACILVTESELQDVPYITRAVSSLETCSVVVTGDFGERSQSQLVDELSQVLIKHGYSLSLERPVVHKNWDDFKIAIPVVAGFSIIFVVLQKLGLVNLVNTGTVTYGTAFAVGVVASLSSCMAVVGGLLLSMSATFAKQGDRVRPQLLFHSGRLTSFFVLGGVIGALGASFTLSVGMSIALNMVIGVVMLILGINLLDIFPWAKKLQPAMPRFLSRRAHAISTLNHALTPLLVGVATFFLPCGFTQSMQLYTLTTGSFLAGGFTMLSFAMGTLPVLALISVSSLSVKNSKWAGVFFKSAGLIVIVFAVFNLINSLVIAGWISPVFNF